MRDVAVVAFAQSKHERRIEGFNEIEMMMPVVGELWDRTGLSANTVGFTCSGSTDFLAGQAFSFVTILDAIGRLEKVMHRERTVPDLNRIKLDLADMQEAISRLGIAGVRIRSVAASSGADSRLSVGMSKKPWIWPECRSMVRTRSAPARSIRLATSLAEIGVRPPVFRS